MSCFFIPKTICNAIKSNQHKFWLGSCENDKKVNWVAWDTMQKSQRDDGMDFWDLHNFNISLLAKQAWNILLNPDSMWVRLLKSLYFPRVSFLASKCKSNCS